MGYVLASPLRRLVQSPEEILRPYVRPGMTVLEPGPGMGFFTLPLARMAGPSGRVVAVDVQPKMLARLKRRAASNGVWEHLDLRLAQPASMGVADLAGQVDFALAFAVVHEVPSPEVFFREIAQSLKQNGKLLLVEPSGHITHSEFGNELESAARAGLRLAARPQVWRSHAALLTRS